MKINTFIKFFIFKKKWKFSIEKKNVDVLVLDNGHAPVKYPEKINIFTIENEIYILNIFISIFQLIFSFKPKNYQKLIDLYFISCVKVFNPKIAIGHEVDGRLFKIKKFFPRIKTILYQFGNYLEIHREYAKERFKNQSFDYFLVWDEWHKSFFKSFVNTNFIISGSIKNNQIEIKKNQKIYDIMLISTFRKPVRNYANTNYDVSSMRSIDMNTSYVTRILENYCNKNKLKFCIALSSNRPDKKNKESINMNHELDFFRRDSKNFYFENCSSYELAEKSNLVVNVYSTLGMELLSRGKKVLFLDLYHYVARHSFIPNNSSGLFWTNENSEKEIENKIESLLNIKDNQWNAELQKYNLGLKFDYKNTILVKLVNELIEK